MGTVAVVDYDMGNTDSVLRAIEESGFTPILSNKEREFVNASHIILPGVGAFNRGMQNLRELGIDEILCRQVIEEKKSFLGICVGMQLLASVGFENTETTGLNWIKGNVSKMIPIDEDERVPQLGWNEVNCRQESLLFSGIPSGVDFYFANSYHYNNVADENVVATTPYCGSIVSALAAENIYGVQFHPEKSQKYGLMLLRNFLQIQ